MFLATLVLSVLLDAVTFLFDSCNVLALSFGLMMKMFLGTNGKLANGRMHLLSADVCSQPQFELPLNFFQNVL